MNSDNLKGVLQQFVSRPLPRCRGRELELPLGTGKVIGLAGVRRSGKTFLFFHTIQRLLAEEALRPLILGEYASLMLYRDVVERYGVRNEALMREMLRFAFRNTASLLNVSKLHRDFASLGFSVSKNTLHEYLGYMEDSFLIFLLRKQAHNPKKMHVMDPGLVAAFQGNPDRDVGHKLETAVFLHLRRRHRELFYHANGGEVNLCNEDGTAFWNSCWSLSDPATVAREQAAMTLGNSRAKNATGQLLYHECAPALRTALPSAKPAWRWLLEP